MKKRKTLLLLTLFTLSSFIYFTLSQGYSFGQNESPLIKAQDLYRNKNFIEAIKVLDAFIKEIQNNKDENKRLAEAYYLSSRINYDSGEVARTDDFLKRALTAYDQIGKRETDIDFRSHLDQVKKEWLKTNTVENEVASANTITNDRMKSQTKERIGVPPGNKKRRILPVILIGVGVATLAVVLAIIKSKPNYDITGTWDMIISYDGQSPLFARVVFQGTIKSGEILYKNFKPGTYTVNGKQVTLSFSEETKYVGEFLDKKNLSGTMTSSFIKGTWSATKVDSAALNSIPPSVCENPFSGSKS